MIKNNILKIIILIYIIIFLKITYGYFLRYNNYLTGGDSRHIADDYTDFLIATYSFKKEFKSDYISILKARILDFIKENPKSPVCIKYKKGSYNYEYYDVSTQKKRNLLADKLISNKFIGSWSNWGKSENTTIKFYIHSNIIYIIFSHIFFDGMSIQDLLFKLVFINSKKPKQNLMSIKYIPFLTELNCFSVLYKCFNLKKRNLKSIPWKERTENRIYYLH